MISITLCMIVKNEQSILERCLTSYAGTYDELIIVDTGSTDSTKDIAHKYTDKVYDYKWCDDFAAARNYAFSLASCDYIFSADADEILDERNNQALKKLKSMLLPEIDIVQMYYVNDNDYNSVYNVHRELRPKLFKRLRPFVWTSPIHETVRLTPVVYDSDIEILHRPVSDHSRRDFSTYLKAFARGTQLEDYVITMLCKELYISGSDKDFLDFKDIFADILINENRSDDIRQEVNCVLVKIYRIAGGMGEFFKLALRCVADNPSSEVCYELGNYYYDINDYAEAAMWYYNAVYETSSVLDITSGGNKPLYALSRCYDKLSETSEDIEQIAQFRQMAEDYKYQAEQWKLPDEIV